MLTHVAKLFRKLRKLGSRSEWTVKLCRLSKSPETGTRAGLIVLQVDGLARTHLENALRQRRMPFLASLLRRGDYTLNDFYSGLPSSTPAVQAELFYGVRSAVPAFQFLDRETARVFTMYEADSARTIAERSGGVTTGLLGGGTSYSNVYSGGAKEARFCAQTADMLSVLKLINPFYLAVLIMLHIPKFFHILGLALLELHLGVADVIRGNWKRGEFMQEIRFIGSRIAVCIMMRELIRFSVKADAARGMPIIVANFLGYDEQAHRRGPGSRMARWAMKGIDDCIRDIFRTARRSDCRHYTVIVYSDHGQEHCTNYQTVHGRSFLNAVTEAFAAGPCAGLPVCSSVPVYTMYKRALLLLRLRANGELASENEAAIILTAAGPLGHVYTPSPLSVADKQFYARRLVEAGTPSVFYADQDKIARVLNSNGDFAVLQDKEKVFGASHPFLQQVADDMSALVCEQPNAGDLVVSGWMPGVRPMTFPVERGAHGGPGSEETRGFVLLPTLDCPPVSFIRPGTLRQWVIAHMQPVSRLTREAAAGRDPDLLRVLTYNIHSCVGLDGKVFPDRIARVIHRLNPDVVALQEVDVNKRRTLHQDQVSLIAERLHMDHVFFCVLQKEEEQYGLAILSHLPFEVIKYGLLPRFPNSRGREWRGALWVCLRTPSGIAHVINTHLGLSAAERVHQVHALLGPQWLGDIQDDEPVILCGDMNATPRSPAYRKLAEAFRDVQVTHPISSSLPTFYSQRPLLRIDHVFISKHFVPCFVQIPGHDECRVASDHLPLCAELRFRRTVKNTRLVRSRHAGSVPMLSIVKRLKTEEERKDCQTNSADPIFFRNRRA